MGEKGEIVMANDTEDSDDVLHDDELQNVEEISDFDAGVIDFTGESMTEEYSDSDEE